jgi:hypothetical protein
MVEVKIFRHGHLNFEELQKLIGQLPKDYVNGSNTKPIMEMLKRRATSAKTETEIFLLLSLQHLVDCVNGIWGASFESAADSKLWKHLGGIAALVGFWPHAKQDKLLEYEVQPLLMAAVAVMPKKLTKPQETEISFVQMNDQS